MCDVQCGVGGVYQYILPEDGNDSDRFGDQFRGAAINGISLHTNGFRRQIACCLISATPASAQINRQEDRQISAPSDGEGTRDFDRRVRDQHSIGDEGKGARTR